MGCRPGPPQWQLRQVLEWTWRPVRLLEECHRRYGDAFTLRMAGLPPIVILSDPAAVREVFIGDPEKAAIRSGEPLPRGGPRPALAGGPRRREHLRERKLMLPPFHGERMRAYAGVIDSIAEREVASWPTNEPFRVAPAMRSIALEGPELADLTGLKRLEERLASPTPAATALPALVAPAQKAGHEGAATCPVIPSPCLPPRSSRWVTWSSGPAVPLRFRVFLAMPQDYPKAATAIGRYDDDKHGRRLRRALA